MAICEEDGCGTRASFNFEGLGAKFCATCKKTGMINVRIETCLEKNCQKQPSFNYNGKTKALYCSEHKKEDMVNLKKKMY